MNALARTAFLTVAVMISPAAIVSSVGQTIIAPPDQVKNSVIKPGKPLVPVRKVSAGRVIQTAHSGTIRIQRGIVPGGMSYSMAMVIIPDAYILPTSRASSKK